MGSIKRKLSKQLRNSMAPFWQQLPVLSRRQADFDLQVSPYELDDIYQFAVSRLPSQATYALTLLCRIVHYPYCTPIREYGQNQIAFYLLNSYSLQSDNDCEILQLIQDGLLHQLGENIGNPAVQAALVYAEFLLGHWSAAAEKLMNLPDHSWQEAILTKTFADLSLGTNLDFLAGNADTEKLTAFETMLAWARQDRPQALLPIALVVGELYIHQGAFLHAFQLYSSLLDQAQQEPLIFSKLGETCWYMDRLCEAEHYYREAIGLLTMNDNPPELKENLRAAKITLAVILCEQGKDTDQAIALFEEQLTNGPPSNPVYHNLAMCYHWKQDYHKSLEYCRKALKLTADETTMLLVAKNYQALKHFDLAVNWCGQALSFAENIQPTFAIDKGMTSQCISFSRPEWLSEKKRDIYQCLIQCHMETGDFAVAAAHLQTAITIWPRDNALANLRTTLTTLTDGQLTTALQAATEHEARQSALVETIKQELTQQYPAAHSLTIEFLATGEFLYRTHQESDMDYSPVLLSYAKALENELTILLSRQGNIALAGKYTLGELVYILRKNTANTGLVTGARAILKLRNDAAHHSIINRLTVQAVRDSLFEEDWFETLWE